MYRRLRQIDLADHGRFCIAVGLTAEFLIMLGILIVLLTPSLW